MKTFVSVVLAGLIVWLVSPQLPNPPDIKKAGKAVSDILQDNISEGEKVTLEYKTFELINQYREEKRLGALKWNDNLHSLAIKHSTYMSETGKFQHSSYNYYENIFKGESYGVKGIPEVALETWQNSPGHNSILLNKSISSGSIGIAKTKGLDYDTYVTFMAD